MTKFPIFAVLAFMLLSAASADIEMSPYNEVEAIIYAFASSVVYCPTDKVMDMSCGRSCAHIEDIYKPVIARRSQGSNSIQYMLLHNPESN